MMDNDTTSEARRDIESERVTLRRATHDANDALAGLVQKLEGLDGDAARAVQRARSALFEAWTILCAPPDEGDDHDH